MLVGIVQGIGKRIEYYLQLRKGGNQSELARHVGVTPQAVQQWIAEETSPRGKNLERTAEYLGVSQVELLFGKQDNSRGVSKRELDEESNYVGFDLLNVEAAAGVGYVSPDYPEVLKRVNVHETWARSSFGDDLSRIKLISARGTSMQGTIENGDVLFVDASIHAYDGDGIYVIARGGDIQVKRLQKLHGDVLAILSDNRAYESERLAGEEADAVVICGRVLAAWTLKRFW